MGTHPMNELEQLRAEVAELKRQLKQQKQLPALPANNVARSLINDQAFIEDLSRFAEGVLTEKQVRQKYHLFDEAIWTALNDDALVERIELEKTRRIRSGATKRELAQNHIVHGPQILNDIATNPKASDKHKIDAIKTLDALADPGAQAARDESDRIVVTINLGRDEKLVFDKPVKPNPNDDGKTIDVTPAQINDTVEEPPPIKRGPGRPPGSKNKPKTTDDSPPLP